MHAKPEPIEDARYERKFALALDDIRTLQYQLRRHPALFTESYAERRVNSVYFDTDDYSSYLDTVSGRSERQKVRVRWYGNDIEQIVEGKIEIKSKRGYLGAKAAFNLGSFATADLLTNYKKVIDASEALDGDCKRLFSFLRPMIIVTYLRKYFISADRAFRITLDYELGFYDVRTGFKPSRKTLAGLCVLELKYPYENDELVRMITSSFPSRYSKSSKYRIGLELL